MALLVKKYRIFRDTPSPMKRNIHKLAVSKMSPFPTGK
jgi:hypothetical protein